MQSGVARLFSAEPCCLIEKGLFSIIHFPPPARRPIIMNQEAENDMPIDTKLTELLGIQHPILSTPMAAIAGARPCRSAAAAR
jgi:hypothetical protein